LTVNQNNIEIPHNRKNYLILCFASIIGIGASGFLMYAFIVILPIGLLWTTSVLTIIALIFLTMLTQSAYLLTKRNPALTISNKGITDNTIDNLQILWSEIKDFKTLEFEPLRAKPYKIILINLKDSSKYINDSKWPKRILLKYNQWYFGTPILLSPKSLKCNFDELELTLNKRRKEHDD
jgi:hypothetical protein